MARKPKVEEAKVYDARRVVWMTPSFAGDYLVAQLEQDAFDRIQRSAEAKAKFCASFDEDPIRALDWSRDTFTDAARLRVAQTLVGWIANSRKQEVDEYTIPSNLEVVKEIRAEFTRDVISAARYGMNRSTSPTSNLAEAAMMSAKAEILEKLERSFEFPHID